jgi:hypothetical protein
MALSDPVYAYSILWETLNQQKKGRRTKVSPAQAEDQLSTYFDSINRSRKNTKKPWYVNVLARLVFLFLTILPLLFPLSILFSLTN